jgi:dUTP diphosphatase
MELKIKRLNDKAIMPIRAHKNDAGLDLTAVDITLEPNDAGQTVVVYHSGLAIEIPEGYVGYIFPRSSIAKKSMFMTNCVGVIDSGYRGEVIAKMHITTNGAPALYQVGERFAQLIIMPVPEVTVTEVTELSETERGEGGYGSSDEKLSALNNNSAQEASSTNDAVQAEQEFEPEAVVSTEDTEVSK